jgi:methylthioribose-1-phosphate isomerase
VASGQTIHEGRVNVDGVPYRSIWLDDDGRSVRIVDQTALPHELRIARLTTLEDAARAIADMQVRGAPLIGATAAYGIALALAGAAADAGAAGDADDAVIEHARRRLLSTRPTAVNLSWALDRVVGVVTPLAAAHRADAAYREAARIADEDVERNRRIGEHGLRLIRAAAARHPDRPVRVLTHCNAGWLATVDWGTATAPLYLAHDEGIDLHVWVDETRPRNQGASLTAWELGHHGVPHAVVVDNAGGHLMQQGLVDLCLVGTDRTTATGDVVNKVGTYLKALAARDTGVPFYVAVPSPSIDWSVEDGRLVPIEERAAEEVALVTGSTADGRIETVRVVAPGSPVANPGFDVTPARLVTALITERGIAPASASGLLGLFPERGATV